MIPEKKKRHKKKLVEWGEAVTNLNLETNSVYIVHLALIFLASCMILSIWNTLFEPIVFDDWKGIIYLFTIVWIVN